MRWSSAQPYRTSNAETNYAFFQLIPLAQIPAGFSCGAGGFHDARNISSASPRRGKGTSRENADVLSHDKDRWTLHLLQRSWSERRADPSPEKDGESIYLYRAIRRLRFHEIGRAHV